MRGNKPYRPTVKEIGEDLELTIEMIKLESRKAVIDGNLIRNLTNKAKLAAIVLNGTIGKGNDE